jgi:nucleoside-diphosphate-sugar epimerase
MHIVGDASRLRESLRWSPKFELERGLDQTVSWWREWMRGHAD